MRDGDDIGEVNEMQLLTAKTSDAKEASKEAAPEANLCEVFQELRLEPDSWTNDPVAKHELCSLFTSFYALIFCILGFILELSHLLHDGLDSKQVGETQEIVFGIYMYGGSLAFFLYCYTVLLQPEMLQNAISWLPKTIKRPSNRTDGSAEETIRPIAEQSKDLIFHRKPSSGSLYLRFGCIVFGIFGIVFHGLEILICILHWCNESNDCNVFGLIISILAILFIFVQMHFVFCHSKITIRGSSKLASLGMMHLVATNLWIWMRFILLEEQSTSMELQQANFTNTKYAGSLTYTDPTNQLKSTYHVGQQENHEDHCHGVNCVLGGFTEFMYTCIVEYALIGAGFSYVLWENTGSETIESRPAKRKRRKHSEANVIAVDCSHTTTGLFLGFAIIAFTFICIAIFNAYIYKHDSQLLANTIFFCTDGILLICSLVAIIFAFFRIRNLQYKQSEADVDENAELLDRFLLFFGLVGQLIFSISGIMSLSSMDNLNYMVVILIIVQYTRLVQVILQSAFLLVAAKLIAVSPEVKRKKPGKQCQKDPFLMTQIIRLYILGFKYVQVITFLLVANIALFIMNTFEAQKAGVTEEIVQFYGSRSWALLVRCCSPLAIFYRFHSSACFAEIWKHTYKAVITSPFQ